MARQSVRHRLGFAPAAVVGIYVGKFGGIYYDAEAFAVFRAAADHFGPTFCLIILTPDAESEVRTKLQVAGLPSESVFVTKAAHPEVPDFLAAADFAFATIKPAPCRLFCSAIKIGEYWASGLPVLLPPGVGDDSAIAEAEGGGAVFDLANAGSLKISLNRLAHLIAAAGYRARIHGLALRHRSLEQARLAYEILLPSR